MPIYEYRCPECGHDFDKIMKFGADAPPCPECGHEKTEKKVSKTSFHLKGTGWYVTDYKDKPTAATTKDEASDTASSDSGGDSDGGSSDSGGSSDDSPSPSASESSSSSSDTGGSSDAA